MRTSYLPNEILWGYRFEHSCVSYDKKESKYAVSITNLNKIVPDNTPRYLIASNLSSSCTYNNASDVALKTGAIKY